MNTAIYNAYLEGAERDEAIEYARIENEISRLNTLYEMTNLQLDQMIKDAEFKVFSESGTYDDLSYLIEEAQAENNEKKDGILVSLAKAITSLIDGIINAVKGLFGSKVDQLPDNATVEIDKSYIDVFDRIKALNPSSVLQSFLSGGFDFKAKVLAGAALGGAGAIVAYNKDKLKTKLEEINGTLANWKNKIGEFANGAIDKSPEPIKKFLTGAKEHICGVIDTIQKAFNTAIDTAMSKAGGAVNAVKGAINNLKGGNNNNPDQNSNLVHAMDGQSGNKYYVDKTTKQPVVYNNGQQVAYDATKVNPQIQDAINKVINELNNQAAQQPTQQPAQDQPAQNVNASVDFESIDLNSIFQEYEEIDYEITEEGNLHIYEKEDLIPVDMSIYGALIESENEYEEAARFDSEMDKLQALFDSL